MAEQLAVWHAEHVNFARLLDLLEGQLAAFHRGDRPDYELMVDIVYYLQTFADRAHHPREDVAFARLAERAPDMQVVINRLLQEHRVIGTAGAELLNRLSDIAEDVMVPRGAVEAAAATYLVYYRHHLDTEERDVMPVAAQLLTPDDWAAVATSSSPPADPLLGDNPDARFQALRKQIAMAARTARHV